MLDLVVICLLTNKGSKSKIIFFKNIKLIVVLLNYASLFGLYFTRAYDITESEGNGKEQTIN